MLLLLAGCSLLELKPMIAPCAEPGDPSTVAESPEASESESDTAVDTDTGSTCPEPSGEAVEHTANVTNDEVWEGGIEHVLPFDLQVSAGATLTIEACAIVSLAPRVTLSIRGESTEGQEARLVVKGDVDQIVTVRQHVEGSPWGAIRGFGAHSLLTFSYADISGGGADGVVPATIWAAGDNDSQNPDPVLRVNHVTITKSGGHGVLLDAAGSFMEGSRDLTVTASGSATFPQPVAMFIRPLESLPFGNYLGNRTDEILVHQSLDVTESQTFPNRGVPIRFFGGRVLVTDPTDPFDEITLTVEPGLELRFDGALILGGGRGAGNAALIALGTDVAPIIFTSSAEADERQPGDWPGIWLRTAVGSQLDHVGIKYAGAISGLSSSNCKPIASSDDAALIIGDGSDEYLPVTATILNSTIINSAGHAINAAWTSDSFGPDVTASNSFGDNVGCTQTKNRLTAGCGGNEGCLVE